MSLQLPPGVPLSQIPAGAPPKGVTPNFDNPPSLEHLIFGVCAVMTPLTLFFVTTRVCLAFQSKHKLVLDEYCCIIATALSFSYTGIVVTQKKHFRHSWDQSLSIYDEAYLKKQFAKDMLLGSSIFFAKMSLLMLYLRIFGPKKSTRYAIYISLAFAFCLYFVNIPVEAYYCAPSAGKGWTLSEIAPKCWNSITLGVVQGSLNVVFDLFIFVLPIPVVMGLQMSLRKRIAVLAVFFTGFLAIAASIFGLVFRVKIFLDEDEWYAAILYICVILETDIAIICSSMPAFASFSKTYVSKSRYIASLRDRFASYFAGSKTKLVSKTRSFPQLKRSQHGDDHSDTVSRLHVGQYSELNDTNGSKATFPSVFTKIHAAPYGDLEEGVIMESLSVEQSAHTTHAADQL